MVLDLNIYESVFALLGVETTGNPVNDAVYLLLLPMVVLYLYSAFVVTMSRFGGKKISVIMMFIVGYVIIEKGFYALFAAYSLPLLGIIMIYHAGSFILGWGHKDDNAPKDIGGYMQGAGDNLKNSGGMSSLGRRLPLSALSVEAQDRLRRELILLGQEWEDTERIMAMKGLTHPPEDISKQRSAILQSAKKELILLDKHTGKFIIGKLNGVPADYKKKLNNLAG